MSREVVPIEVLRLYQVRETAVFRDNWLLCHIRTTCGLRWLLQHFGGRVRQSAIARLKLHKNHAVNQAT